MFGFFYYSEKQNAVLGNSDKKHRTFARTLTGKVVEYTEWVPRLPFRPTGLWDDYKLVAIGWYDHSEER